MFLSYKRLILLRILLASLAISSCVGLPAGTSPEPSTPEKKTLGEPQGAPLKGNRKAPKEVTDYIMEWMHNKEDRLRAFASTKGGAEAWVQLDFEVETKERQSIDVEEPIHMREQRVYGKSATAADWVFKPGPKHGGLIVELKVESSAQYGSTLAQKVLEDRAKISGPIDEKYEEYDTAVLAIAWSSKTDEALTKANMIRVRTSDIKMETKSANGEDQVIRLYEWNGVLKDAAPLLKSTLEPGGPPLAKPVAGFAYALRVGEQTPQVQNPGESSADQTADTKTPSKKKVKNLVNKLKTGGNKKGSGGGASGSKL